MVYGTPTILYNIKTIYIQTIKKSNTNKTRAKAECASSSENNLVCALSSFTLPYNVCQYTYIRHI